MDFWTYLRDKIQFANGEWKNIYDQYVSENQIVSVDISILDDKMKSISKEDYRTIPLTEKRFAFKQHPISLSAKFNSKFVTIFGSIPVMARTSPYIQSVTYVCKNCGSSNVQMNEIPIFDINRDRYICESNACKFNEQKIDIRESYVDCVELQISTENRQIHAFISNTNEFGFDEVIGKLSSAYAAHYLVNFHGILHISEAYGKKSYVMEIIDIDLLQPMSQSSKMIPFIISNRPATEKEMVMGIFFSNLSFFKHYLRFTSYELRKAYPDLIAYDGEKIKNIEFEFDAANFYAHGHHNSHIHCDLIVAWKDTSKKKDIPVLLLPDLQNRYITENVHEYTSQYDPNEILGIISDTIQFCFKNRSKESIMPLLFPIISSRAYSELYPISVTFLLVGNTDDMKSLKILRKIFPISHNKIKILTDAKKTDTNSIIIKISPLESKNEIENPLDIVEKAKNYMYLLKNIGNVSPAPIQGKSVYASAYEYTHDIEKSNVLVALASILSSFALNDNVIAEDVKNAWEILKGVL